MNRKPYQYGRHGSLGLRDGDQGEDAKTPIDRLHHVGDNAQDYGVAETCKPVGMAENPCGVSTVEEWTDFLERKAKTD